jgi:hypothetical protein
MSRWNHPMCGNCWNEMRPGEIPYRVREEFRDEKPIRCCFCGKPHQSGIFVRHDPRDPLLVCKGEHEP